MRATRHPTPPSACEHCEDAHDAAFSAIDAAVPSSSDDAGPLAIDVARIIQWQDPVVPAVPRAPLVPPRSSLDEVNRPQRC